MEVFHFLLSFFFVSGIKAGIEENQGDRPENSMILSKGIQTK